MTLSLVEVFLQHMKECPRCAENPSGPCFELFRLLEATRKAMNEELEDLQRRVKTMNPEEVQAELAKARQEVKRAGIEATRYSIEADRAQAEADRLKKELDEDTH